ncbi:MAG: discoidin domain-containing protein [Clostridia bacterium]|nr:discoidin domain-containing protein [Clostridia bacterium]
MKKLWILLTFLAVALVLAACGNPDVTTSTTQDTTATPTVTTTVETTTEAPPSTDQLEESEDYTAVLNGAVWDGGTAIDTDQFVLCGVGDDIAPQIAAKYKNRKYYVQNDDGSKTEIKYADVKKLGMMGVTVNTLDDGTNEIFFTAIDVKVQLAWKSVSARAGSYLMFDFTANLPLDYIVTVTKTEGGKASAALYTEDNIYATKAGDGSYAGIAKCTVPHSKDQTFYINLCTGGGDVVLASIPVHTTEPKYDSEFKLIFQGDWELVKREDYLSDLVDLFYNVYPRLYARWGVGDPNVPKTISFVADKNYDGVAYCAGTIVCVSTAYANEQPYDIGFFSHEITHSVQQYGGKLNYGETSTYNGVTYDAWWTENMASYGGFRYFHWGYSTKYIQFYDAEEFINWGENYAGYGDGCQVFLSYLDWKFPTVDKNGDGVAQPEELGVIDRINYVIKHSDVLIYDTPTNPNTPFSRAVYDATGGQFDCLDAIRSVYQEDIASGAFRVNGFANYQDNFITENIKGVPNPNYPMMVTEAPGNIKNPVTEQNETKTPTLPEGENLLLGATVVKVSSANSVSKGAEMMFDGNLTTQWYGSKSTVKDYFAVLKGAQQAVIVDLGEVKTFDTYVLVNAGISQNDLFNTASWEILISKDGKTFTSVDYQTSMTADVVTVNIGLQEARYLELRIHKSAKNDTGVVRINEWMLYKTE